MAIEIKQLVIRATVEARPAPGVATVESDNTVVHHGQPRRSMTTSPSAHADLVEACVRRVLRELRKSRER